MKKNFFNTILILLTAFILISCSESNIITPPAETLLYENSGLVDSAVVYGCYAFTIRHFVPDTFALDNYSKIKIEFDGNTNSDGTKTFIFIHSENSPNNNIYEAHDLAGINKMHNFEADKTENTAWVEVRLYINPPVCGKNEFKFNSARNLKIYGVR